MCVRPSTAFYSSFSLGMGRSPGFGSMLCDFCAQLRLGFPSAPHFPCLTLPHCITRRTVLQKVRSPPLYRCPTACRHRVSGSLSLPSRGSFHLSFTVLSSIGHSEYLALGGGPPSFPQNFTCFVVLRILPAASAFRLRGFHPLRRSFPEALAKPLPALCSPYPGVPAPRFGLLRFRSPLLTESMFLSFPPPT